jgi:hypothetical protein
MRGAGQAARGREDAAAVAVDTLCVATRPSVQWSRAIDEGSSLGGQGVADRTFLTGTSTVGQMDIHGDVIRRHAVGTCDLLQGVPLWRMVGAEGGRGGRGRRGQDSAYRMDIVAETVEAMVGVTVAERANACSFQNSRGRRDNTRFVGGAVRGWRWSGVSIAHRNERLADMGMEFEEDEVDAGENRAAMEAAEAKRVISKAQEDARHIMPQREVRRPSSARHGRGDAFAAASTATQCSVAPRQQQASNGDRA